MNLTIHERHGGGFFIQLDGPKLTALMDLNQMGLKQTLAAVDGVQGTSDTLTLTLEQGEPVTFSSFADLQRLLHGEIRLALES